MSHDQDSGDQSGVQDHQPEQRESHDSSSVDRSQKLADANGAGMGSSRRLAEQADADAESEVIPPEQMELPFEGSVTLKYSRSGPLPSAAELADYERVMPGLAREIVDEAHANMRSDRRINEVGVDTAVKLDLRGQLYAILLCVACLALAACCVFLIDNSTVAIGGATVFGIGAAAPVVNSFLQRKSSDRPDSDPGQELADRD
ncbi:DUF2335 domain-containing protein [Rhodococcus sp. P1Y]|nr:DUF2335 domain-containing protein [Rhodococcus sp. P1Y]